MKYRSLALAAAALMAGVLSFGGAHAANVMTGSGAPTGITKIDDGNVQQASHRKWRKWRRHGRWHRRHRNRSGIFLGLGFAPLFYTPHYYEPYYYDSYYAPVGGSRHVRYCLRRYQTYHIPSDTFRGFDGLRHRCRSPYRY
jgi:hypothetical protein